MFTLRFLDNYRDINVFKKLTIVLLHEGIKAGKKRSIERALSKHYHAADDEIKKALSEDYSILWRIVTYRSSARRKPLATNTDEHKQENFSHQFLQNYLKKQSEATETPDDGHGTASGTKYNEAR